MARRPGISADTKSSRADNRLGCQYLVSLARTWDQRRIARLQIVINPRLKSTLARWVPPEDVLEVSLAAQTRGKRLFREILCHEAAHVVVWHESGPSARPHGPEWAALMRAAGFNARATLSRCGHRRKPTGTVRVRHLCAICHFSRLAKRRMPHWRCPECTAIGLDGRLQTERWLKR
jgi:predicted SprT family Zn-dependent metalloprotease